MTYDVLASQDTIKAAMEEAKEQLKDGEVQRARKLMTGLASEIEYRTTNTPLATSRARRSSSWRILDAVVPMLIKMIGGSLSQRLGRNKPFDNH